MMANRSQFSLMTRLLLTALVTLANIKSFSICEQWQTNVRPKLFAQLSDRDFQSFAGILRDSSPLGIGVSGIRNHSSTDFFTTLLYTNMVDNVLLVGARNILYKLDAQELRLTQTMRWPSEVAEIEKCTVKGKEPFQCQNYIKVLQQYKNDPDKYLVCGTNAFKPLCREYFDERGSYVQRNERSGLGLAPFSHTHNSTAVLVNEDLFAGTVADFQGVDPIVFRHPLRTVQYDSTQLNRPDFVGSFEHGNFVYLFFREAAVEYMNCGKAIFTRVARVCKKDQGFRQNSRSSWTSFFKIRLNCSVPGDYPFYLDEIQGVSSLLEGRYGTGAADDTTAGSSINEIRDKNRKDRKSVKPEHILYATFSTPANSIGASAVCAFRLRDIDDAFSGKFKEQRDSSANWLPVPDHKVPVPRPGTCQNSSKPVTDSVQNFIKTHTLMDETVSPFFGSPIILRTGLTSARFTAVTVDPQVTATNGKAYDVLYIGTTSGRVLKVVNAKSADLRDDVATVIVEELQVFRHNTIIKELKVMSGGGQRSLGRLAVLSDGEVRSIAVQRCDRATNCQACVALQDPYCAWDVRSSRCGSGDWTSNMESSFIQSVASGKHAFCPMVTGIMGSSLDSGDVVTASDAMFTYQHLYGMPPPPLGEVVNILEDEDATDGGSPTLTTDSGNELSSHRDVVVKEASHLFSLETLIITVSAGAVAALVVGFVTGYCCGRRCHKDDIPPHMPAFQETDYEYFEQQGGLARPLTYGGPPPGRLGGPLMPTESAKLDNRQEEVTYAEPELVTGVGMGTGGSGGPLNSRYVGGLAQPPSTHYSSSLLTNANKFNTIHSSVNKRAAPSMGTPNHYESAADRVVGGSGLKDYTRIGEGGGPLLALRERDFMNQNHHMINSGANPAYHLSTLGRSSSMKGPSQTLRNPDPTTMLLNTAAAQSAAGTTSAGGSSSSSGGGMNSLLTSNEEMRGSGGKRGQDSAYGTTRSTKEVYL